MQSILLTATAEKVTIVESAQESAIVEDDGLPPPTHVQVQYWRELCGAISATGAAGMMHQGWSADLAPSKPTLKAMVERGLIVRRRRGWHLKRGWYGKIIALRARAVP